MSVEFEFIIVAVLPPTVTVAPVKLKPLTETAVPASINGEARAVTLFVIESSNVKSQVP